MKKTLSTLFIAGLLAAPMIAQAEEAAPAAEPAKVEGDCVVHYVRTACEGQEETSYAKCDGQQECDKAKEAASVEECQAAALKSCGNDRLDITKSKVITATYKGEAIKSASGNDDFCADYENREAEYNQCPEDKAGEAAPEAESGEAPAEEQK